MSRSRGVLVLLCLAVASSLAAGAPAHAGSGGRHPFGTPMRNYLAGRQSRVGAIAPIQRNAVPAFVSFFRTLGASRIIAMGVVTLGLMGFFAFLIMRAAAPQMSPLFTDLSVEDSSAIIKDLERQGIPYDIKNEGAILLVPREQVPRLRMKLAEGGLPKGGLTHTSPQYHWGLTLTTAPDQVHLVKTLVKCSALYGKRAAYGLHLMENVESDQRWGVSAGARNESGTTIALKNGWLPETDERQWIINSVGWISGNGRNYVLAVLTDENPSMTYGVDTIEGVARIVWNDLG